MSKSRRDITLGEAFDECNSRAFCGGCPFGFLCENGSGKIPVNWDLTDHPQFNEEQVAFWDGWHGIGMKFVRRRFGTGCVDFSMSTVGFCSSCSCVLPNEIAIKLEEGKVYSLEYLIGKDDNA